MIYIVVPCYNEEAVLAETTRQLANVIQSLVRPARILYVDDGSRDGTWSLIERLGGEYAEVRGVRLAHNVGHQQALWAGMEHVAGEAEAIVSIDADLQDDVDVIGRMVKDYTEGADVVYGVRASRATDSVFKRWTAQAFYRFMTAMGSETVYNHADFRLLSQRALRALLAHHERNLFLRGMVPLLGFNVRKEYYDRKERQAGESKYPLSKMLSLAVDGVTSFSVKPLRLIMIMGLAFILIALGVILWALVEYVRGNTIQGWTSLLVSLWFVGGTILLALGITGEYIGKIYNEVKHRPLYFIMDEVGK
ncbi:MAG: glycosyltransferase family 2 protein [Bacteroidaceae bacterium]|nr:glycosyltransferase family 2 protein [Bacteroidaceae bacterium]